MKRIFAMITSALLALFTTSCFEQSAVIRLNKDGSGTITETTLLGAEASAMLEGMAAQGGGEDPLAKMTDKELTAAYAKKLREGHALIAVGYNADTKEESDADRMTIEAILIDSGGLNMSYTSDWTITVVGRGSRPS